jgi:hypothetical protein
MNTRVQAGPESPRRRTLAFAMPVIAGALALFAVAMPASADALSLSASEPRSRGPVIPVEDADGFLWLCREDDEGKQSTCIPWPQPEGESIGVTLGMVLR